MHSFLDAFSFISSHRHLLFNKLVVHIELSAKAMLIAIVISVPLGVLLGHIHRLSFLAINVANLGRALPSLAVLAILIPLIGIGRTDVIIALVVLAVPPILTNAYVGVDQVDADTVDAARGMGLRHWYVMTRVEVPIALPLIFSGIRTAAVFVVATATLAGFFGGGGLGDIIANEPTYRLRGVIGASYVLIVLALFVQIVLFSLERLMTPAGLRRHKATSARNKTLFVSGGSLEINRDILDPR